MILLWLGREEIVKEQKETFINVLVELKDGCGDFYGYRAYFIAAAGIVEFGNCSRADEIVAQVIKWDVIDGLESGTQEALLATDSLKAITELLNLINHSQEEDIRFQSAWRLGQIDKGNQRAVDVLDQLSQKSQKEYIRSLAGYRLREIRKGDPKAIAKIVELIQIHTDPNILLSLIEDLGEIGETSSKAIDALIELIQAYQNRPLLQRCAIINIGKLGQKNSKAVDALVKVIKTSQNQDICLEALWSLGQIGEGNSTAITALVELITNSQDSTKQLAAQSLGKIDPGNSLAVNTILELINNSQINFSHAIIALENVGENNPDTIAALVKLIYQNEQDKLFIVQAIKTLKKIGRGKFSSRAIDALVDLAKRFQDENILLQISITLSQIDNTNPISLTILRELIEQSQDEYIRIKVAEILGKNDKSASIAIKTLIEIIRQSIDETIAWKAIETLGEVGQDNSAAIKILVELIQHSQEPITRFNAVNSLKNILREPRLAEDVIVLKDYLLNPIQNHGSERFQDCYKVIWYCAQNMTYPVFHQAWHSQPTPTNL